MTQTAQATKPAYTSNLFFKEIGGKGTGNWEPLDIRLIVQTNGAGWLQTRTHIHMHGEEGKRRPFTFECTHENHHPNYLQGRACHFCDEQNKRFGAAVGKPVRADFWAWAIDLKDGNKLKYIKLPYSVKKSIDDQTTDRDSLGFAESGNVWDIPLRITRKGSKLNTEYSVTVLRATEGFHLGDTLYNQGFTEIPPIMAEHTSGKYPPITKLSAEQYTNLIAGKLPWNTADSDGGHDTAQAYVPVSMTVDASAPATAPAYQTQATEPAPQNFNQSYVAATPAQEAMAQGQSTAAYVTPGAPVDVQTDTLPASFDAEDSKPDLDITATGVSYF